MKELKEDFVVQCCVCKQRYTNHAGSTECCGSVAELLDDNMEPVEVRGYSTVEAGSKNSTKKGVQF